ncbi:hypothetical protein [Mycolicibacterium sp.]|uniref:hypothetical protein n=1 Tax=Mycolicibacterium sp. TaxID=2320850 RepID=UPI0037C5F271
MTHDREESRPVTETLTDQLAAAFDRYEQAFNHANLRLQDRHKFARWFAQSPLADVSEAYSAWLRVGLLPERSDVQIGQVLSEALAAWFHKRDELFEIRSGDTSGMSRHEDAVSAMDELVDIGDEIVAELVPDRAARCRITGEAE